MQNKRQAPASIRALAALLILSFSFVIAPVLPSAADGVKLYGGINELVAMCQSTGLTLSANKLPATVLNVRLGSTALYAGAAKGDKVLKADLDRNVLSLTIERDGKRYGLRMAINAAALRAMQGTVDGSQNTLHGKIPKEVLEKLATHDIVIIVDKSGSMTTPDCGGTTRWQWCRDQAVNFMQQTTGAINKITIITFSVEYNVHNNCTMDDVRQVFLNESPETATATAAPLSQALNDFFNKTPPRKPLLVAVITDGLPNIPGGPKIAEDAVRKTIIDAANKIAAPDDISITFLVVGNAFEGYEFTHELDQNLVNEGAHYDIVSTKDFAELQSVGLLQALVDAVQAGK